MVHSGHTCCQTPALSTSSRSEQLQHIDSLGLPSHHNVSCGHNLYLKEGCGSHLNAYMKGMKCLLSQGLLLKLQNTMAFYPAKSHHGSLEGGVFRVGRLYPLKIWGEAL
jgi:hypothetical protein